MAAGLAANQLVSSSTVDFGSLMAAAAASSTSSAASTASSLLGHSANHHGDHHHRHLHHQPTRGNSSNGSQSARNGSSIADGNHVTIPSALLSMAVSPSMSLYGHPLPLSSINGNAGLLSSHVPTSIAAEQQNSHSFFNHTFSNFDLGSMPFFNSMSLQKLAGCKSGNCKLVFFIWFCV